MVYEYYKRIDFYIKKKNLEPIRYYSIIRTIIKMKTNKLENNK